MKKTLHITLAMVIAALLGACSSSPKDQPEPDYLPELKAEIPDELQDNPEVVEYIETTTEALNELSINLEDLFVKIEPYVKKDESELSTMEKLKMSKHVLAFTAQMAKVGARMATMKQTYHMMSDNLTQEEQQALDVINETFEKRIRELDKKYQDLDNIQMYPDEEMPEPDSAMV